MMYGPLFVIEARLVYLCTDGGDDVWQHQGRIVESSSETPRIIAHSILRMTVDCCKSCRSYRLTLKVPVRPTVAHQVSIIWNRLKTKSCRISFAASNISHFRVITM